MLVHNCRHNPIVITALLCDNSKVRTILNWSVQREQRGYVQKNGFKFVFSLTYFFWGGGRGGFDLQKNNLTWHKMALL